MIPGEHIELSIEKPAAGGRMLSRHGGQVVLVLGCIPGERVRARVERVERQLAFAATVEVLEASVDRRAATGDLLCGGCVYSHVAYRRQLGLKAEVIRDAFTRLGRIRLDDEVEVAESPEHDYRMRARLHVRGRDVGFYREGSHELCDPEPSRQLSGAAVKAVRAVADALARAGSPATTVELSENIAADQRVAHVTLAADAELTDAALDAAVEAGALTGCSGQSADGAFRTSGVPVVADPLPVLTIGKAVDGQLERHAESFFQANRFLLPLLVQHVTDAVPADGDVLDLYAGVGLFSVSLAAAGRRGITAVEGDRSSGRDLQRNAARWGGAIRVSVGSVESHLKRTRGPAPSAIIVDPPRTGISREAMAAVVSRAAARVLYVSCDPATMARDARRLLDAGYRLRGLRAFDLFPNTPHVESFAVFER